VTPGYPNLFYMFGPNTNPPGGSFINLAEVQGRYIVSLISTMVRGGISAVDCRADLYEKYNAEVDAANSRLVYGKDGVESYYRNSDGRVVTNSPWTVLEYWRMTERPELSDYRVSYRHAAAAAEAPTPKLALVTGEES
jgi:4-hydroxyacetophenone monooxygenase